MPPHNTSTQPSSGPIMTIDASKKEKAAWTHEDVVKFLDYLISQVATAGDGIHFQTKTYTAAARLLNESRVRGAAKTAKGCLNKFNGLRKTHQVIDHLVNHASGFTYSEKNGADIDDASEAAWASYLISHPDAKPFRNKGWPYFDKMEQLASPRTRTTRIRVMGILPPPGGVPGSPTVWPDELPEEDEDDEGEKEKENSDEDRSSVSPTPTSRSSSSGGGRKRAAMATTPIQGNGPAKRVRYSAGAHAFGSIAAAAHNMNEILGGWQSIFAAPAAAAAPVAGAPVSSTSGSNANATVNANANANTQIYQPSPVRKTDALLRAQRLENYLAPSDLAIICDILGNSVAKADIYNALVVDAVRVGWVQDQLRKHTLEGGLDFSTF
ncbi:Myb-DNA-bind-3 domain-containing protein [Mycena venus]|uniref:Myb-DNA-bind-3 domain-containing protein n=1 Tax=Mycena venus TaxID=2733690 RepID=A0A8H7CT04_9AGAR|nr:Myb-DNA-bind-3 domain-containing protein [Mycena venus]